MRFKTLPPTPPAEIAVVDALTAVRDALPPVPRSEDDCCGRLVDRIAWIDERAVATEWIVLLRALELAERSDAGYSRVRGEIDSNVLAARFRDRILGADEAIDALGDEPRTPETVFEAVEAVVPEWERRRSDAWETEWRRHTERLLAWAALLGLAAEADGGYVRH